MGNLKLTSSAFSDGGEIPRECGYKNGNKVPPLAVSGIPEMAESLVLIMDDPDAMGAVGKVWLHWLVWDIFPDHTKGYTDEMDSFPGDNCIEGVTDFGEVGYGGPAPPDKRHTYVFKVYALDCSLGDDGEELDTTMPSFVDGDIPVTKAKVEKAMEGHIIEQTQLTGTYAP
jgi:Raf kinase inhibitor-like YbhB/YbcL family protein